MAGNAGASAGRGGASAGSGGTSGGRGGAAAGSGGTSAGSGGSGPSACPANGGPRVVEITSVIGSGDKLGGKVTTDAAGAAYLTGSFSNVVDFYPRPGDGLSTALLARAGLVVKVDALGNRMWARRIGGPEPTGVIDIVDVAATPSGTIVVNGTLSGTMDLDPGPGVDMQTAPDGSFRAFLLALSPEGTRVWSRVLDPTVAEYTRRLKIAANGSIYAVGVVGPTTSVLKLDATGSPVWTATFQAAAHPTGGQMGRVGVSDVARAADGTLWVVGQYAFAADLDPGPAVVLRSQSFTNSYADAVIVKLDDTTGDYRGGWTFGGATDDIAKHVETRGDAVYVGGDFSLTVDFKLQGSSRMLTAQPASSGFVMRIDPAATEIPSWVYVPQGRRTTLNGLAVADSGLYLTGWVDAHTPGEPCVSGGLWVGKLAADGTPAWTISDGGLGTTARSISVAGAVLHVTGEYGDSWTTSPDVPGSGLFLATYGL